MANERLDWFQKRVGNRFEMKMCCGLLRIKDKQLCQLEELQVGGATATDRNRDV